MTTPVIFTPVYGNALHSLPDNTVLYMYIFRSGFSSLKIEKPAEVLVRNVKYLTFHKKLKSGAWSKTDSGYRSGAVYYRTLEECEQAFKLRLEMEKKIAETHSKKLKNDVVLIQQQLENFHV